MAATKFSFFTFEHQTAVISRASSWSPGFYFNFFFLQLTHISPLHKSIFCIEIWYIHAKYIFPSFCSFIKYKIFYGLEVFRGKNRKFLCLYAFVWRVQYSENHSELERALHLKMINNIKGRLMHKIDTFVQTLFFITRSSS